MTDILQQNAHELAVGTLKDEIRFLRSQLDDERERHKEAKVYLENQINDLRIANRTHTNVMDGLPRNGYLEISFVDYQLLQIKDLRLLAEVLIDRVLHGIWNLTKAVEKKKADGSLPEDPMDKLRAERETMPYVQRGVTDGEGQEA